MSLRAPVLLLTLVIAEGCRTAPSGEVVVYASEDQIFSEPILRNFERETGIRVRAVFDTEEAKSTGVVNRLIAEKGQPQADVYWANEPIRAEYLKQQGITAPYRSPNAEGIPARFKDPEGHWTGFSARARVFIVNRRAASDRPAGIRDYAAPRFRGRAVIANPLFGSTTAHVAALFAVLGDDGARRFLEGLKQNGVKISSGNGESADLVAAGEFDFGLVDTDDVFSRLAQGRPVDVVYPDQDQGGTGVFVIPNAVLLVAGAPHPAAGKRLIDSLLSKETEQKLAFSDASQIPLHEGVETPPRITPIERLQVMEVDYGEVARKMREIQPYLKTWVGY
jgi:iron(III) transport system substrate-binding protein